MDTCSLFEEDEVYVYNAGKGYKFGLIIENSEFLSSSDEDDMENPEDLLQKGTVRISWHPSGKETVVAESKVALVDRSLMPGDVVRKLALGGKGQCGFVMDMEVQAHLRVLRSNKYIYNVNSKDLQYIQKFEGGQEVMLDSWWGKVENVNIEIVLVFPDGARCKIEEGKLVIYEDVTEKQRSGEFVSLHYPGQELKVPMDSLRKAKWLNSTPRHCHKVANRIGKINTVHVTVENVLTKSVEVNWVFGGGNTNEAAGTSLAREVEGENVERLKILDWFSHCSLQIGDRLLYRIKNDDAVVTVAPNKAYDPKTAMNKGASFRGWPGLAEPSQGNEVDNRGAAASPDAEMDEDEDNDYEDILVEKDEEKSTSSSARAVGGRGRKKKAGLKSASMHYKASKQNQAPKGGAKKRGGTREERVVKPDTVVEVETELTMSWAAVMWQDGTIERDIPSIELFPVHHLDEHEFFPGDFVLPNIDLPNPVDYGVVSRADHVERTCTVHWFRYYEEGKSAQPTLVEANCEMSVYDVKDHPLYKFRPGQSVMSLGGENGHEGAAKQSSSIGQIIDLDPNGHLVVKWADGSISQRFPQEVFVVSEESDDDSDDDSWGSDSDESDASAETWETESEQEILGEDDGSKSDKDDDDVDQVALNGHMKELNALLHRTELALSKLQGLLNSLDLPLSASDCYQDVLRIYRSCHDLDKILKSSFFDEPELQSLITQAKLELKRDKTYKISKQLSQLFEARMQNAPKLVSGGMSIGYVDIDGKTLQFSVVENPHGEDKASLGDGKDLVTFSEDPKLVEDCGASGGHQCDEKLALCDPTLPNSFNTESCNTLSEAVGIKKGASEPTVGKCQGDGEITEQLSQSGHNRKDVDSIRENNVAKGSKRVKVDCIDESGREVKKSKDTKDSSHIAQDLCFRICTNLQKQIALIQEEMKKRTNKLISAVENQRKDDAPKVSADSSEHVTSTVAPNSVCASETADLANSCDSVTSESVISKPLEASGETLVASKDEVFKEPKNDVDFHGVDGCIVSEIAYGADSISHSMDEPTEWHRLNALHPHQRNPEEKGDGKSLSLTSECLDAKNEVSCEGTVTQEETETLASSSDFKCSQFLCKGFEIQEEVKLCHKFVAKDSQPLNPRTFRAAMKKELKLFQSSLPDGIFVKGFEDRLDLYSVMILGSEGTPYEDAVFLFDLMLPNDYPTSPPLCHYHSYCSDRLNPNLYEDGKVCISLLGTWSGKGTEMWTSKSNLLQVLLSIQGLILVPEPYYNEAGFVRQKGTKSGEENSRLYNEMAILKTVHSLINMCQNLPIMFKEEIRRYLLVHGPKMIARFYKWMKMSETYREVEHHLENKELVSDTSAKTLAGSQKENNGSTSTHQSPESSASSSTVSHVKAQCEAVHVLGLGCPPVEEKAQDQDLVTSVDIRVAATGAHSHTSSNISLAGDSGSSFQSGGSLNAQNHHMDDMNVIDCQVHGKSSEDEKVQYRAGIDVATSSPTMKVMAGRTTKQDGTAQVSNQLENLSLEALGECQGENQHIKQTNDICSDTSLLKNPNQDPDKVCIQTNESIQNAEQLKDLIKELQDTSFNAPDFPLFPISRGFRITLEKCLKLYEACLIQMASGVSSSN